MASAVCVYYTMYCCVNHCRRRCAVVVMSNPHPTYNITTIAPTHTTALPTHYVAVLNPKPRVYIISSSQHHSLAFSLRYIYIHCKYIPTTTRFHFEAHTGVVYLVYRYASQSTSSVCTYSIQCVIYTNLHVVMMLCFEASLLYDLKWSVALSSRVVSLYFHGNAASIQARSNYE